MIMYDFYYILCLFKIKYFIIFIYFAQFSLSNTVFSSIYNVRTFLVFFLYQKIAISIKKEDMR